MLKKAHITKLIKKEEIAKDTFDFYVEAPQIAKAASPGQFIHVKCGDGTFLRRPISICDTEGDILRFIFQIRGKGTAELAQKEVGDYIDILGPLGQGFKIKDKKAFLVGGGIGIYPLLMLAKKLKDPKIFLGFRTKDLVTLEEDFKKWGQVIISTDDGSYGRKGFSIDAVKEMIDECEIIYACGPIPMLKALKNLAEDRGIECQISLEQRMGCGVGACLSCVCKTVRGYDKICQRGPVFDSSEVIFDD
ncbi:MAG: dihydroorotate dehydrogenase electron transfer subunit [Clostridiaceae bacterium]|nr:dihydroorotate dehydrogenase electron transfer subunit [Clostridiaceae bacterium]